MSCETEDHLFTPFYSTKSKGSGIWDCPFVTKSLVNIWGKLFCTTTKNTGTKFTIELPLDQK